MLFDARTTVLIIDDSQTVRESLRTMLGMTNITRAETVSSASEARNKLKVRHFDVVLCDYNLGPGMDGQELLEVTRKDGLLPFSTIWIMITGERKYERVVSAAEMAPDDYLIKPFTANQLMDRLHAAAERKAFLAPAYKLIESGQTSEAIQLLAKLGQQEEAPSQYRVDAHKLRAELLVSTGRQHEALQIYQTLLSQRIIPWARMGVARIYSEQGQMDQANELLMGLINEAPLYTDAYDLLAKHLSTDGQYQDAVAVLEKAVSISPRNFLRLHNCGVAALRAGDAQKSVAYLQKAIEIGRGSSAELLEDLLLAYSLAGDTQDISRVQAELAALLGDNPHGKFMQAVSGALAAVAGGRNEEAFATLTSVAEQLRAPWLDFKAAIRFLEAVVCLPPALPGTLLETWVRQITWRFAHSRHSLGEVQQTIRNHPACLAVTDKAFADQLRQNHHAAELVSAGKQAEASAMLFEVAMETMNERTGMNACAMLLKVYDELHSKRQDTQKCEKNLRALLAWLPPENERVKGFIARLNAKYS